MPRSVVTIWILPFLLSVLLPNAHRALAYQSFSGFHLWADKKHGARPTHFHGLWRVGFPLVVFVLSVI